MARHRLIYGPPRLEWHEVMKVARYYALACAVLGTVDRSVNAMTRPMQVRQEEALYRVNALTGSMQVREDEAPYGVTLALREKT